MKFPSARTRLALGLMTAAALAACGGDDDSPGSGNGNGNGTLRLALTDAPACGFDTVYVTVERIRVHQSSAAADADAGWHDLVLNPPRRVDLLSLTNGVLYELGELPLPPGAYQQMRLVLADNGASTPLANAVRPTGGTEVALTTPSGQQSGIKLNANVKIAANQMADYVIDFDACKSVVTAGQSGQYLLKPVVSVVPRLVSGVSGSVDAALFNAGALVTLQQGGAVVRATAPDVNGRYVLQLVPAGTYSVVFTAPGRTTLAVNGVPVVEGAVTALGAPLSPLSMPVSPTATVNVAAPITTQVRALQTLSAGPTIEVASRTAPPPTGAFSFSLPTNAPLVASYAAAPAALVFSPDAAAAGRYALHAHLDSFVDKLIALPVLTAGATVNQAIDFP